MNDISVFGLQAQVVASQTFPAGFNVTQFADDADPVDSPVLQIKDKAMGINGDLIVWSKANPVPLTISVVPDSEDDRNLTVLFEANRVGKGKFGARDVVTVILIYPSGDVAAFTQGAITDGPPISGAQSSGRLKSKTYSFAFENVNRA